MIRNFLVALAALTAFGAGSIAVPQRADAQTLEQSQNVGEWAAQFQRIVLGFVQPLQQLPSPPDPSMNRTERRAWAATARTWAATAQASFTAARADLERLPASPPAHDAMSGRLREAIESALPRLREALDAGDRISSAYLSLADAVDRNQMDRVNAIRVIAIDAALVSTRLFQDTNAAQDAAATEGNPQGPLAGSYAHSYAAMWAVLKYRRDLMAGDPVDRLAAANGVADAARQMSQSIVSGRADLALLNAQLGDPAIVASIEPALVPRLRAVAATFDESFDREELVVGDFEQIAALLRDPRGGDANESAIDFHLNAFATRDAERMNDIQRRNSIMTAP